MRDSFGRKAKAYFEDSPDYRKSVEFKRVLAAVDSFEWGDYGAIVKGTSIGTFDVPIAKRLTDYANRLYAFRADNGFFLDLAMF
jgi:hypothetical protein